MINFYAAGQVKMIDYKDQMTKIQMTFQSADNPQEKFTLTLSDIALAKILGISDKDSREEYITNILKAFVRPATLGIFQDGIPWSYPVPEEWPVEFETYIKSLTNQNKGEKGRVDLPTMLDSNTPFYVYSFLKYLEGKVKNDKNLQEIWTPYLEEFVKYPKMLYDIETEEASDEM